MWVRGLKLNTLNIVNVLLYVAPHVGAWIETIYTQDCNRQRSVAPHVGAWIETELVDEIGDTIKVAPHVGAWIETIDSLNSFSGILRRTPCGCVD